MYIYYTCILYNHIIYIYITAYVKDNFEVTDDAEMATLDVSLTKSAWKQ